MDDRYYMRRALFLAKTAFQEGEVPIGAVIVNESGIIAEGYNQVELLNDATAHAEMLAITAAENTIDNWRLGDCTLYVTIEPCMMCSGAILLSRIGRIVYGAKDPRMGFMESNYNAVEGLKLYKNVKVENGLMADEAEYLMKEFFKKIRNK